MSDTEVDEAWVESLRGEHESNKEWAIKKSFVLAHAENYNKERLVCLANCFINMELYGCRYPQPVMDEINGMAAQLSELVEYRNDKKKREAKRIQFVEATSAPKKRKNDEVASYDDEKPSTSKAKFPMFVSAGNIKPEVKTEEMDTSHKNDNSKQQKSDLMDRLNGRNTFKLNTDNLNGNHTENCTDLSKPTTSSDTADSSNNRFTVNIPKPQLTKCYQDVYHKVEPHIKMKTKTIGNLLVLNCDDPAAGFLLQLAPQSQTVNSMHMSLEASKHVLDQIVDESADTFSMTIDSRIVCTVDRKRIRSLGKLQTNARPHKIATHMMLQKLVNYLLPKCWIIIRKNLSSAAQAVTSDNIADSKKNEVVSLSKGMAMLKSLGWSEGSGLGSKGQGIKAPVTVETTVHRQGLGFGTDGKNLHQCALTYFKSYVRDCRSDVLIFSSEFNSEERKILHMAARVCHLKSKSRGYRDHRCLTVMREGVPLGQQIKQIIDCGSYNSDWCSVIPPGAEIVWSETNTS